MAAKSILDKLQMKPGRTLLIQCAPEGYLEVAGDAPPGALITTETQSAFIVQVFIRSHAELAAAFESLAPLVLSGGMLWITYPKLTSKLKGDIHRDTINSFAQQNGWIGIAIISIDDDWSALRMKRL